MKIYRQKKEPTIPNASMSDIAFLLIIFFMATTKFDVKEGLSLVLPPAAQEGSKIVKLSTENMTRLFVSNNGDIYFNEDNLGAFNQSLIDTRVKQIIARKPDMIFTLKTDRDAKYNDMIRVLDRLKAIGVQKISLSTN